MAASLFFLPFPTAFNSNGLAVPGAKLYFYVTGTSTPIASYSDSALTTANAHPVVANGAGRFESIYLDSTVTYRLVIKDSDGNTLDDVDPYIPGVFSGGEQGPQGPPGDMSADYKVRTPYMFGAVGDGLTDDTAALQAFFDDAADVDNAEMYVYDWTGEWLVSDTIYAAYRDIALADACPTRRFKCGTLRVDYPANLPGGVPLEWAMEIAGYRQQWEGDLAVYPAGDRYATAYANRHYVNGVRIRSASASYFGDFRIDGCKRTSVLIDSSESGGFTVNGITFPNANCIGVRVGSVWSRYSGSYGTGTMGTRTAVTVIEEGSTVADEVFESANAATSFNQRSKLTVTSTADIRVGDLVRGQHTVAAATSGTIAFDNATSKMIWSAGNPVTAGLKVGDQYRVVTGDNASVWYTIVSFGGTDNREMVVSPEPYTSAAAALDLYGKPSWHSVRNVIDSTNLTVYPIYPARNNSPLYIAHGAVIDIAGSDASTISVNWVGGLSVGFTVWVHALYSAVFGTILADFAEVGIRLGVYNGNTIGFKNLGGHLEACNAPILIEGAVSGSLAAEASMVTEDIQVLYLRDGEAEQPMRPATLGNLSLFLDGEFLGASYQSSHEGNSYDFYELSNLPARREQYVHIDTATVTVGYDETVARLAAKHHWARLIWTDADGTAPDGTLTLELSSTLTSGGWTFVGGGATYAITAPGNCVRLELQYLHSAKIVTVQRYDAA